MDGFPESLPPGAYVGCSDSQDCFVHWMVFPARRRFLGVRYPVSGILGAYLFLPFGLGPPLGWSDFCVKVVHTAARARLPTIRALDIVGDLRLVDASGEHDPIAARMAGLTSFPDDMGIRYLA